MIAAAAFVFGAILGSFLNVCIYRLPKGESVVFPGSHCGACGKPVRGYDNIPILSYFILRGRCRDCRAPFSIQYALVELFTGALTVLFYLQFGLTAIGAVLWLFTLALVVESAIDFKHRIIPDVITLPGIVLGLLCSAAFPILQGAADWRQGFFYSALGVIIGGGFLYLVGTIAEKILKKEAMGGGDVKLLAMIGAFLGFTGVLWSVFLGSLLGAVAGIYYRLTQKDEQIPFGPFLGLAAVLYIFFGNQVIEWYSRFLQSGV